MNPERLRIAVVGGGLAGLSAAWELLADDDLDAELRLFEAEAHLGGVIRTREHEGYLLESAADSFFTDKPGGLELAVELGLVDELIPVHSEHGVQIWWDDRLHPMPPGLSLVAPTRLRGLFESSLFTLGGKLRAALEPLVPARRRADESIASFVNRRFGGQMLERVGDPLLAGIHAGDPTMLSIHHTFPRLPELERKHGSVIRGLKRRRRAASRSAGGDRPVDATNSTRIELREEIAGARFVSFRRGMQTLTDRLADAVRRADPEALRPSTAVVTLRPGNGNPARSGRFRLGLSDGSWWTADGCILAVPARAAAELTEGFDPVLAVELGAIPHASTLAVYLAYAPGAVGAMPAGTGCLIPHSQGHPVFAMSFLHRKLDGRTPEEGKLIRAFMGGMRKPELVRGRDATLVRIARDEAETLLGITATPLFSRVVRWPRAHPQYVVGHGQRVARIDERLAAWPGLHLAGASCRGVGIPDVIASGRAAARAVRDWRR